MSGTSVFENSSVGANGRDVNAQINAWSKCTATTISSVHNFRDKVGATVNATTLIWKPVCTDISTFVSNHSTAISCVSGLTGVAVIGGVYLVVKKHKDKKKEIENNEKENE